MPMKLHDVCSPPNYVSISRVITENVSAFYKPEKLPALAYQARFFFILHVNVQCTKK